MTFIVLLFLSCGEKTADTSTQGSEASEASEVEENNVQVDCPRLDEEACLSSQSCTPIMAAPISYNEEELCWIREEKHFVECMNAENSCGDMIIHAKPTPSSQCMMFETSCIPILWRICNDQEFIECTQ